MREFYILTVQYLPGIITLRILYENAGNTGVCIMFNFSIEIRVLSPNVGVILLVAE